MMKTATSTFSSPNTGSFPFRRRCVALALSKILILLVVTYSSLARIACADWLAPRNGDGGGNGEGGEHSQCDATLDSRGGATTGDDDDDDRPPLGHPMPPSGGIDDIDGGSPPSSSSTSGGGHGNGNDGNNGNNSGSKSPPVFDGVGGSAKPVTVKIPGFGRAQGRREGGVDVWRGIPYAAPPVGALRFAPPEPAQPWAPTRLDASRFGPDCWQSTDPVANPGADESRMSEDCLYLNVWTPAGHAARSRQGKFMSGTKLLPVMVWLHGGAFQQGGARRVEFDGRNLAERDVVVVTINYRLGALGFLVSSGDGLYGNFGLMDQRAAIYWIHENVEAFGGDPNSVTLFGESAGAVMTGLHLMMEGVGTLFHRAIMQSNPLGYTFRSVVVADFIGEALKHKVDCRDLACLRAERVEEILGAQASLMGVPRSVGDFFTWGPTLTKEVKVSLTLRSDGRFLGRSEEHRLPRVGDSAAHNSRQFVSEWRRSDEVESKSGSSRWSAVNVSQPLKGLDMIPDDIPIVIGSNKHEGEIFVHSAFPAPMPKAVYWMFVGALFRDSSARILKHYRGLVEEVERIAEEVARKQLEEEEAKQEYLENREQLEREYELLLAMNATRKRAKLQDESFEGLKAVVKTWSVGGHMDSDAADSATTRDEDSGKKAWLARNPFLKRRKQLVGFSDQKRMDRAERAAIRMQQRAARKKMRQKEKALKEAAKVVVDYRPVMSRIIDDYLFRCPSWHMAQLLSENREARGVSDNVFVYRFSQPTHIPGYKECWGKSCHTAELPFVFQSMDILRSNYSTVGPIAQKEAPSAPEYPYTKILEAYRGAVEAADNDVTFADDGGGHHREAHGETNHTHHQNKAFKKIIKHFFGDYFTVDADEELASDMAERWSSFAISGNPNYDGSKEEWLPWWYRPGTSSAGEPDDRDKSCGTPYSWGNEGDQYWRHDDEERWSDVDEDGFETDVNEFEDVEADEDRRAINDHKFYRRKALEALQMEVVEEDVFRTELRRVKPRSASKDHADRSFLSGKIPQLGRRQDDDVRGRRRLPKQSAEEILRMAQEMGVMGEGLRGEEVQKPEFLPELLDLSWPPEGRLIERDCTCDMWDRIRYRY